MKKVTREELLRSSEFWEGNLKTELYNMIQDYLDENNLTQKQLAEQIGVSTGYISQILNGDSDHRISKLVGLTLAIGKVPYLYLKDIEKVIEADKKKAPIFLDFEELEEKANKCDAILDEMNNPNRNLKYGT